MEDESVDQAEFAKAVGSGRQFADRVRTERQERGWSQAELARRMRAIGQPLDQAAISKIESPPTDRERPRRIDIDEAIGFARVFGLSLEQMTIPLASPYELSALRILANSTRYSREWREIRVAYLKAVSLVAAASIVYPAVGAQLADRRENASNSNQSSEREFLDDVDERVQEYRDSPKPLQHVAFGITSPLSEDALRVFLGKQLLAFEWPGGVALGPIDFRTDDG